MDKILQEIKEIINQNIKKHLLEVSLEELEEHGTIYYMNGKNGTEWDYYVNEHISYFMVFYNDKDNLGAIKLCLYNDGGVLLYIYNDHGKNLFKRIETSIKADKNDLFKLAVLLKKEMDDKRIWDADINMVDTSIQICDKDIDSFRSNIKYYESSKKRLELISKTAYVSKRITEENYKIGYMHRDEPLNDNDSGWSFMAGNEDEEYINKNIVLLSINDVINSFDSDIMNYIDNPIGSDFIRVSSNKFEEDDLNKKIYIDKR